MVVSLVSGHVAAPAFATTAARGLDGRRVENSSQHARLVADAMSRIRCAVDRAAHAVNERRTDVQKSKPIQNQTAKIAQATNAAARMSTTTFLPSFVACQSSRHASRIASTRALTAGSQRCSRTTTGARRRCTWRWFEIPPCRNQRTGVLTQSVRPPSRNWVSPALVSRVSLYVYGRGTSSVRQQGGPSAVWGTLRGAGGDRP